MANSSDSGSPQADSAEFDEDAFEWEVRKSTTPFWQHAMAGSCAGVMEHVCMFPLDTVKTRMQASPVRMTMVDAFQTVLRERGVLGFMRGSAVIGAGCIPAHVGLFGTYEFAKVRLLDPNFDGHQPVQAAACGAVATLAHDAIITPIDVVKQRLQLGGYAGAVDCAASIWRLEGSSSFFRSLPTTLAMNIPYMGLMVATNESLKLFLRISSSDHAEKNLLSSAPLYFLSAGASGALAAAVTLPMDVVKTKLQTQGACMAPTGVSLHQGPTRPLRYRGLFGTVDIIMAEEGFRGFFRGMAPRVTLAVPSAAICWGTYETVRLLLGKIRLQENGWISLSRTSTKSGAIPCAPSQPSCQPGV